MNGRVDVIIDGGDSDFGLESTIVKINDDCSLTLLRPGKVSPDDLSMLGFCVNIDSAVTDKLKEGVRVLSPGMKYKHYAPKAEFILLDGEREEIIEYLKKVGDGHTAVLCYSEDVSKLRSLNLGFGIFDFGSINNPETQAHLLFNLLREIDKKSYVKAFAPLPSKSGIGLALYNRMIRAAAHKIIRL